VSKNATQERRVKHAMFSYQVEIPHPVNPEAPPVLIERMAYHGQTVDLLPHDVTRGEAHDAFFTDAEPQTGAGARYASQFDHSGLVAWMKAEKPNIQTITGLANEDPDPKQAAQKLLAAEKEATGNDPRSGLVIGLEAIVAGAEQEETEEQERLQAEKDAEETK
jgi:hypothetical protein